MSWVMNFLDGTPIFLKQDTGLCDQFPYVQLEYLNSIKCESVTMLRTVRRNFEGFTKWEVEKSNLSCKVQAMLGYPTDKKYLQMVSNRTDIANFPISPTDITNERIMYGPDLAGLIEKNMRNELIKVEMENLQTPNVFYQLYRFVTITPDVMFVISMEFLTAL